MAHIQKVTQGLQNYKSLADSAQTLEQRKNIMRQLMIDLTIFENIPPCMNMDKKECILAREVYEYATFLSVEKKDINEFERNICVLKSFYDEFEDTIPKSSKKYAVLGLYLLYLLSYNKYSQYHTEIELISQHIIDTDIHIKVPVSLETYFEQGSYNKILTQQQNVPLASYQFFIDKFVDAIRYQIARSSERSYDSLKLTDMQKMFMIDDKAKLMEFIKQNQQMDYAQKQDRTVWEIRGDRLHFLKEKKEVTDIPSIAMINTSLMYATELNRII